ncbi:MAG: hypothetical protein H6725_09450 [Sandaracinaceae bacterium]|nr:hypothetical protein [Sandaracinaceae bacterium]
MWWGSGSGLCARPRRQLTLTQGEIEQCLANAPQSDLDIFALPHEPDLSLVQRSVELTRSACLFLGDSGNESALA